MLTFFLEMGTFAPAPLGNKWQWNVGFGPKMNKWLQKALLQIHPEAVVVTKQYVLQLPVEAAVAAAS